MRWLATDVEQAGAEGVQPAVNPAPHGSPELKNVAKLPATAVMTKMAHSPRRRRRPSRAGHRIRHGRGHRQQLYRLEERRVAEIVDRAAWVPVLGQPLKKRADQEHHEREPDGQ